MGVENMKKLLKLTDNMNINQKDIETIDRTCEVCLKAKQTRMSFGETRGRAKRPLGLIHTDVCGPIKPSTWNGKRYLVTFLDDYTNFLYGISH